MTDAPAPLSPGNRNRSLITTALALLPLLLQLPSLLAGGFGLVAAAVAALSWRRPLPAALRALLVLAMLGLIYWQMGARPGRDTGCALLAAMLAIKSSELRSLRDARSLLGFALFAPFSAFLLDQGPLTLVLAIAAVLSALWTLQCLADEEGRGATAAPGEHLRGIGRLVLLALPLALAAFWLFPRLGTPLWGIPERALARPGLSDSMHPGEWIDLMADDSPALRAQFFGPVPEPQQRYWRGPVLTDFDGRSWRRPRWRPEREPPPTVPGAPRWDYRIEYEPTDSRQLVALDLPLQPPEGTRLDADYSLYSHRPLSVMTRWHLQSAAPVQFQPDLSAASRRQALALPEGFNPRTRVLGQQWRQQAGADDTAIVNRALAWIRAEFGYTLSTPLPGRHGVDEFLFQHKAGFCEHFSSAFVVLMRSAGIPARVVTGYAGGVRNRFGDYWVVRRMDAHAWAEVWLPERGWVRVDPTAAVAPERIYDTLENRLGQGGAEGAVTLGDRWLEVTQFADWMRRGWNELVLSFDAERQQRMLRPLGIERLEPPHLIALFAVAAAAMLGWMAWLLARGERERDPLLRAWHQLGRRYTRRGLGRQPHEPALEWARRIDAIAPDPQLVALSGRFAAARYAGADPQPASLLRDLRRHRPNPGARP